MYEYVCMVCARREREREREQERERERESLIESRVDVNGQTRQVKAMLGVERGCTKHACTKHAWVGRGCQGVYDGGTSAGTNTMNMS